MSARARSSTKLRPDVSAAERAYADYLSNRVQPQDIALLPAQHRPIAASGLSGDAAVTALQAIDDPLARLIAASVLFQGGRANPAAIALAVETASDQGWRRPLLAWLGVQLALAEKSGDWPAPSNCVGVLHSLAALSTASDRCRARRQPAATSGHIEIDPSRKSVRSSQTLTSTGWPRRAISRAWRKTGSTSSVRRTTRPAAPSPCATAW